MVNSKIVPKIIIEKGSVQIHHVADHNLRRTGFLSGINTQRLAKTRLNASFILYSIELNNLQKKKKPSISW